MADGICIGVPVANGYPTAPPLPTSTVSGHHAPPPPHTGGTDPQLSKKQTCLQETMAFGLFLLFMALILWPMSMAGDNEKPPSFQVQSVSVLFDKSSNDPNSHATWNIGLSVKSGEGGDDQFDCNDLDVSFRCMSSNWSRTVVSQSSNNQDPKNMTSLSATVDTLLPRSFQGSTLEFDVMFRVKFVEHAIQAVCSNLTVGLSPDATEGMMEGGPTLCH